MEEKSLTWRDLLGKAASNSAERCRIAEALGINMITVARWVTGQSNPRLETLRALPHAVPQYREQLIELLSSEYPGLFINNPVVDIQLKPPASFYSEVLNIYAMHPQHMRAHLLGNIILQQIIQQFDSDNLGFAAFIVRCVPPIAGQKVQSMHTILGQGETLPALQIEQQTWFCGAESQAGLAVQAARPIVLQNMEDMKRIAPHQHMSTAGSCAAAPIMQYDRIAGCLCLVSKQENYFLSEQSTLLKQYSDLFTTLFEPQEFYAHAEIELVIMPSRSQQAPTLTHLQERINGYMLTSSPRGKPLLRSAAELEVLRAIEKELCYLALHPEQP